MSPSSRWTFGVPARAARLAGVVLAAVMVLVSSPRPASAAAGDVYAKGTEWCASTYPGHGTLGGFGPPLDLNGKGGVNDMGWPVHAPEDGSVSIHSKVSDGDGWGNSIVWKSADGTERIHMAHLQSFEATGQVTAGEVIGRVGDTGWATGPHLHVSAERDGAPAEVELMGKIIKAGSCYVSSGPLPPTCMGQTATIYGGASDEVLVGTAGADVIVGMGGNDVIRARGGADVICGGPGKDQLLGKSGDDVIRGEKGADTIQGGVGADRLKGGAGPDTIRGGIGPDRLFGQPGNDELAGSAGADRVSGGPGRDTVTYITATRSVALFLAKGTAAGEGSDTLISIESAHGSPFDDLLAGDAGDNHLAGDAGHDVLKGKRGEDTLDGGDGTDTCTGGETVVDCES